MKGLGANRSRHLSDSCEPAGCSQKPLCPLTSDPHSSFLLSPTINHYGTLDPHLHQCPPTSPTTLTPDCLLPFSQMSNSSTFPRLHFTSQTDQVDCSQACMATGGGVGQGSRAGALSTSLSMGMGLGLGLTGAPMITSGSATISSAAAAKMNRLPSSLLDQLERHLPLQRDGFSTLQFHRGRMSKQRSESPGRIRHLMHSVQKLFAKSQSLENSAIKGSLNGRSAGGMTGTTGSGEDSGRPTRRSKSKDRAKTEGQKQRPRPSTLGLWGSDDALDTDTTKAGTIAVGYRNPLSMMTLGRAVSDSQAPPRHIPQGYNTISAHTLKTSKSSSDLKFLACPATQVGSKEEEERTRGSKDDTLVKRGSWSTLTLTQARQVLQKGSATVNRTMLKSKSCHQDLAQQFLQVGGLVSIHLHHHFLEVCMDLFIISLCMSCFFNVWAPGIFIVTFAEFLTSRDNHITFFKPLLHILTIILRNTRKCQQGYCIILYFKVFHKAFVCIIQVPLGDWAGTLGHGKTKGTEIPCRRMRSGSYVKAMGDVEDSDDSEGSPKPSPKSAARRLSYMKATQQSLSEQQPPPTPRKWVPQCSESKYDLVYHAHCFATVDFVPFYITSIKI